MKSFWLALVLAASACLFAQGLGRITGHVKSTAGAPVPNAVVIVTATSDGSSQRTVSGPDGTFAISNLAPGTYRIEIESQGFQRAQQDQLVVTANEPLSFAVELAQGTGATTVAIRAKTPTVQDDTAEESRSYDSRIVRELPVQDRNVQEFIGLMPGVTPPIPTESPLADPQRNREWNTNGQPAMSNSKTFEGMQNQEASPTARSGLCRSNRCGNWM